ncbi:MAG: histidinol dehydrogenase [Thermodesulfobacteriota bacterium]
MKIIKISKNNLSRTLKNIEKGYSQFNSRKVMTTESIVKDVQKNGNKALFKYTKQFDNFELNSRNLIVRDKEIKNALNHVPKDVLRDLKLAARRISDYQKKKLPKASSFKDNLGNELGWEIRPVEKTGIYVPGGKAAYPSTVLMTAIPAKVAGVKEISIATPCPNGEINPAVLAAASICGVDKIYRVGGAQAVAALAYGTRSVNKVDKIVGPGNIYVTIAKKLVYGVVDIDSLAGPSEVLIISDRSCPPSWVAADLLAQAEHDEMAIPTLITTSYKYATEVKKEVTRQLNKLQRKKIAIKSVTNNGRAYVVSNLNYAAEISNRIAPEHLELSVKSPKKLLKKIINAGAVFLGPMSTESFGDYVSGPSHVLPTGGAARFSSPLSVYDFIKMPSTISISKKGFTTLSGSVMNLAYAEGLEAHALSVKARL